MDRLSEIRAWRARFSVHGELAGLTRAEALEVDPESDLGPVPVYQHTADDYDFLLGEIDRMTEGLRAICHGLNSFSYKSPTDILIDARVALTGSPREEIEAEHTVQLGAEASARLAEMIGTSSVDESGRSYADRMREMAEQARARGRKDG